MSEKKLLLVNCSLDAMKENLSLFSSLCDDIKKRTAKHFHSIIFECHNINKHTRDGKKVLATILFYEALWIAEMSRKINKT